MSFPGSAFISLPRLHLPQQGSQQGRPNFLPLGTPSPRQPSVGSFPSAPCPTFTIKRPVNFSDKCSTVQVNHLSPVSKPGGPRVKRNTQHVSFSEMEDFDLDVKGYADYRKHDLVKFRKLDNQVLEDKDCWLVEKDGYLWGDDRPETIPDFNAAEEDEWMDDAEFQQHGRNPFLSNALLNQQEAHREQEWFIASFSATSGMGMEVEGGVTPTGWTTPAASGWASPTTTPGGRVYISGRRGPALTPISGVCADLSLFGFPEFPTPAEIQAAAEERWDD